MKDSVRRKHQPALKSDAIHPPHQQGQRVSRESLISAIENPTRSKTNVDIVLNENRHAIDKVRYFAEHPETIGAKDREVSATNTVVLTTEWIRRGLHLRVDLAEKNRASASRPRSDALRREIEALLDKTPLATAKQILRALNHRAGRDGSVIKKIADDGIHWVDKQGRLRVTSEATLASRLTRLRRKGRKRP